MWRVSGQSVDRRSQILLMTSQINEGDHFARVVADLLRRLAVGVVDGPTFRIETQNFVTYRRSATRLDLVQMTEHVESGPPTSVVQFSLGKNS